MKMTPLHDRVFVKQFEEKDKTDGGIFVPDTAKGFFFQGEVVAVGDGEILKDGTIRPLEVKIGHHVIFGKVAEKMEFDGEEYLIMREDNVLGIIE